MTDLFAAQRTKMVKEQLKRRGIKDTAVLQAMAQVPREQFVPPSYQKFAYRDGPLPIPCQQTISQPYVVALMIASLSLRPTDRVLEIGTGSGYAAAILAKMVAEVHTVERHPELISYATERILQLNISNIYIHCGDGSLGWPAKAPYDAIIVAAGGPAIPTTLKQQLSPGGRLVMPVGQKQRRQELIHVVCTNPGEYQEENMGAVAFVPLIGEAGWDNSA